MVRENCPGCGEKGALFKYNRCIHCEYEKPVTPSAAPRGTLTERQKQKWSIKEPGWNANAEKGIKR
jgi:hypothetical protein